MFSEGLIILFFTRLVLMAALTIAFGGFGFLFLSAVFPQKLGTDFGEISAWSISAGIAAVLVMVTGLSALGIRLTEITLLISFLLAISVLIILGLRNFRKGVLQFSSVNSQNRSSILFFVYLGLLLLAASALQIQDIFVPNWIDGLVHTTLLQKFATNQAIPFDRVYHTGFHIIALAAYTLGAGTLPESVLLLGQWLSMVLAINLFLLTKQYLTRSWAGYLGVFIFSFLLLFPTHLLVWGRYPFLLGLVLLPPTALSSLDWIYGRRQNYVVALLLLISLILAHYGAFVIWLAFIFTQLIAQWIVPENEDRNDGSSKRLTVRLLLLMAPLLLFMIPKLINFFNHPALLKGVTGQSSPLEFDSETLAVLNLVTGNNSIFVVLWGIGIILSLVRKDKIFWVIAFWPFTAWLLTWIQYAFIGTAVTTYANALMFFSVPMALACGFLAEQAGLWLSKSRFNRILSRHALSKKGLPFAAILAISILAIWLDSRSFTPDTVLFTRDDSAAMNWIENNTPRDSVFMINSFIWGNDLMPSDGGGWINILTGRKSIFPQLGEFYDACAYIKAKNINYLYLGQTVSDHSFDLRLEDFAGIYKIVYETQGVTIASVACH